MQQLTVAFIGGGNMAEALIAGLRRSGHEGERIVVAEPNAARGEALTAEYGIRALQDNCAAARGADILLLAVKPQQMKAALAGLANCLKPDATIISIAAGITSASLAEWLGSERHIVRVMPNTPALVGEGMSAMFSQAGDDHRARAEYVLNACGQSLWVEKEEQLHAVTALSGSGPAYFFLLAELMQAAGAALGLPKELAAKLVAQTALGAGKMLVESAREPEQLRQQVTSPGGTTQAALDEMFEMGMPAAVRKGVIAAAKRSEELS